MRQQKRYRNLNKKKLEAEINTLELERKRIAADIHDEFGPVLSAAKLNISSISTVLQEDSASISRSLAHIDHVINMIRHISDTLTPGILLRKGLIAAVEDYLGKFIKDSGLAVTLISDNGLPDLSPDQEMHTYRIIQELIHNTVKHADAAKLKIELDHRENDLVIRSSDDGIGFLFDRMRAGNSGLGLTILQTRVDILGGEMNINTHPGKGTRYHIKIPLNKK